MLVVVMNNEQIRISAKNLGSLALTNFCPRCFWLKCTGSAWIGQTLLSGYTYFYLICLWQIKVFKGIRESRIHFEGSGWTLRPTPTVFRHPGWLSLVGCTSTEPTSVSPADTILVSSFIFVKLLFIMMPSAELCELLWLRRVSHLGRHGSFRIGLGVCHWALHIQ